MYGVDEVIRNINSQPVLVSIMAFYSMIVGYVQCIESVRLGFRDKTHAMPLAATTYFFCHDSYYAAMCFFGGGFSDHWFFASGGFIILPYTLLEIIIAWQIITYSRKEIGLGSTWGRAFLSYVGIQAVMLIFFLWTRTTMDDPLYLTTTLSSLFVSQAFMIPLVLRRKSRKGQSVLLAATLCFGFGISHFFYYPLLADYFGSPIVLLAGAASTALAAVYLVLVIKAPRYDRRNDPQEAAPEHIGATPSLSTM